jgi:hypothetical protein
MARNARYRGISVMGGSDTCNASAFSHGRWHGKEMELFVKEVGIPPMEAIVANTSRNAWLRDLEQRPDCRHYRAAAAERNFDHHQGRLGRRSITKAIQVRSVALKGEGRLYRLRGSRS